GLVNAQHGRFAEATADFGKVIELRPEDHDAWFWLAPILAREGKVESYRNHCRASLERFGNATDPVTAERTAKECLILPSSEADLERVAKMVDLALEVGTDHWAFKWFQSTKGILKYRLGHFSSAADLMREVLAAAGHELNRDAEAYMVLAM